MRSSHQATRQQPSSLRGELWLLISVAVLITVIALLHLAVQRERAVGSAQFDLQLISGMLSGDSAETVRMARKEP